MANIVAEFTRAISSTYENDVIVHFLDLVFVVKKPILWSMISVPPYVKSYSYKPGFSFLSSLVVPNILGWVASINTFFFPDEAVLTTYEDMDRSPSFSQYISVDSEWFTILYFF